MNRQTTIIDPFKDEYVAIVRIFEDRVTLITNADNARKREDVFVASSEKSAERLYTSVKEALVAMVPHSGRLIWQEA